MLEAELFSLFEHTSDAALVVTEEGDIRAWNKAAEKLFGYSAAEAVTRTCHDLLDGFGSLGTKVCAAGCSVQNCAARHLELPDFNLRVRTGSGNRLWVNVSTIIFEEPRLNRRLIVHLMRDISHYKRNEAALAKILEVTHELTAPSADGDANVHAAHLSEQERRILRLFTKGENSSEIARELGISLPTLRNHLHSINQKLGTHSRLEAVMQAMRRSLL